MQKGEGDFEKNVDLVFTASGSYPFQCSACIHSLHFQENNYFSWDLNIFRATKKILNGCEEFDWYIYKSLNADTCLKTEIWLIDGVSGILINLFCILM